MSTISKAFQKARRTMQAEGSAVEASNIGALDLTEGHGRPTYEVRDIITKGHFTSVEEHLVTLLYPESIESEHYQRLRFAVERMHQAGEATVIGLSSAGAGDGKTLTTLNLAGSLGRDRKQRILVVDADLRNPSVAPYLGLTSSGGGLGAALRNPSVERLCRFHPEYNIAVLAANAPEPAPYEVLKSLEVRSLFEQARRLFDFVLVDMSPLIFPECRLVMELIDGLLLVIAAHQTQRTAVARGLASVDSSKIVGIVFNRDSEQRRLTPNYHYRSG
jgi:Mrp family chromosome partitioning ATPase